MTGGGSVGRGCSSASAPGNMDSMINHYTANKKVRNADAYSPGGRIGLRPDRATLGYCQRAREAYPGVPVIAGGVEASLRRLAHYDYWSRQGPPVDPARLQSRLARLRHGRRGDPRNRPAAGRGRIGQRPARHAGRGLCLGASEPIPAWPSVGCMSGAKRTMIRAIGRLHLPLADTHTITLPTFEQVVADKPAFAEATRIIHNETNPYNAKRLVQWHDRQAIVANPPPFPISQASMDAIYTLPYTRRPHPSYSEPIPAFEHDQGLGHDHARLLWRLHVLLDHRAPGPHHPVAQQRIGPRRNRAAWPPIPKFKGDDQRHRRPDRQHVRDEVHEARGRSDLPPAVVRASDDLQAAGHRSRPAHRTDERGPRSARHQKGARRQRHPHGPGPPLARSTCASWPSITSAATSRSPPSTPIPMCS